MKRIDAFCGTAINDNCLLTDLLPDDTVSIEYTHYRLDVENLNFERMDKYRHNINKKSIERFIQKYKLPVSVEEFCVLWTIQVALYDFFPDFSKKRPYRRDVFAAGGYSAKHPMNLSEAFKQQIAACQECCLFAQLYLQHCGIKESRICCGRAWTRSAAELNDEDIRTGAKGRNAHAYISVRLNGSYYFYDPANPIFSKNNAPFPAIMSHAHITKKDHIDFRKIFDSSVKDGGGVCYIESKDIYTGNRIWLYGFESDSKEKDGRVIERRRNRTAIKYNTHVDNVQR